MTITFCPDDFCINSAGHPGPHDPVFLDEGPSLPPFWTPNPTTAPTTPDLPAAPLAAQPTVEAEQLNLFG